jgi:hypothetical protein
MLLREPGEIASTMTATSSSVRRSASPVPDYHLGSRSPEIDPTHLHGQVREAGVIQPATGSGAPQRRPSAAETWLKAIELTSRIEAEPHRLFADVVEEWARRQPWRLALLSGRQSFTYGELAARINRYARRARRQGIRNGRTVCLLMPNRPDYPACWLGISRVGGTAALINTRLVGRSLVHCIDVDPSVMGGPLFLRDPATGDYRPIDRAVYARIVKAESGSGVGSESRFS